MKTFLKYVLPLLASLYIVLSTIREYIPSNIDSIQSLAGFLVASSLSLLILIPAGIFIFLALTTVSSLILGEK